MRWWTESNDGIRGVFSLCKLGDSRPSGVIVDELGKFGFDEKGVEGKLGVILGHWVHLARAGSIG